MHLWARSVSQSVTWGERERERAWVSHPKVQRYFTLQVYRMLIICTQTNSFIIMVRYVHSWHCPHIVDIILSCIKTAHFYEYIHTSASHWFSPAFLFRAFQQAQFFVETCYLAIVDVHRSWISMSLSFLYPDPPIETFTYNSMLWFSPWSFSFYYVPPSCLLWISLSRGTNRCQSCQSVTRPYSRCKEENDSFKFNACTKIADSPLSRKESCRLLTPSFHNCISAAIR